MLNEFTVSEWPLLKQLHAMDWEVVLGNLEYPANTFRTSFADTILTEKLKAACRRVNLDHNGHEWLYDVKLDRAVRV